MILSNIDCYGITDPVSGYTVGNFPFIFTEDKFQAVSVDLIVTVAGQQIKEAVRQLIE